MKQKSKENEEKDKEIEGTENPIYLATFQSGTDINDIRKEQHIYHARVLWEKITTLGLPNVTDAKNVAMV